MKKITGLLSVLMIVSILFWGLSVPVKAYDNYIGFSDPTTTVGSNFTVSMDVYPDVTGIQVQLSYNTEYMTFVSASGTNINASGNTSSGTVTVLGMTDDGSERHFSCVLTFTAVKVGYVSDAVRVVSAKLSTAEGDSVPGVYTGYTSDVTINASTTPTTPPTAPPTQPTTQPTTTQPPTTAPTQPPTTAPTRTASGESRLTSLSFSEGTLSPSFDPNTNSYTLRVDADTDSLSVRYAVMEEHASAIYWPYPLNIPYGETSFGIRVTAENGNQTDYYVTIIREQAGTVPPTETSGEATTEEPDTEESTEETTEESSEAPFPDIYIPSDGFSLKLLPLPEDFEVPANHTVIQLTDEDGFAYDVLAPVEADGTVLDSYYIYYGIREDIEDAEPAFYLFDRAEGTLQRFGLAVLPEETEETTKESTEETTEPVSGSETETEPVTTDPVTTPDQTLPVPTTQEVLPENSQNGLPWWGWLLIAVLFGLAVLAILLLMRDKQKLTQELHEKEQLTGDEQEAFLSMNNGAMLASLQAGKPAAGEAAGVAAMAETPAAPAVEFEDLDEILTKEEAASAQTTESGSDPLEMPEEKPEDNTNE